MATISKLMTRFIVAQGTLPYVGDMKIWVASKNMDAVQYLQDLGFKWNGDSGTWLSEDGTRWARIYPVRSIE